MEFEAYLPLPLSPYEKRARAALPAMHEAREAGAKCARQFAIFLNAANVQPPSGKKWTEGSYLKARRHLFNLRLASPPLDHHAARDNCHGHEARRAALEEKLKSAGEAYAHKSSDETDFVPVTLLSKLKPTI